MLDLLFATHNTHKLTEVQQMLPNYHILSLLDINYTDEIVEDGTTFSENAAIKVDAIRKKTKHHIFGDDSGLVVPALNNAPGIYSSRYAGTGRSEDNIQKILENLKGNQDRSAYFITVVCLWFDNKKYFFEGRVEGSILTEIEGSGGFGYDPIFIPDGYDKSFAMLSADEKNRISHRGKAIEAMKTFLNDRI